MEHHRVVGLVGVVMMPAPIGCAQMNLHIPRPHLATDINLGVEEVGAGIGVEQTGVDDRDFAAIVGNKPCGVPQTVLPHILHQFLNHIQYRKFIPGKRRARVQAAYRRDAGR